MNTESVVVSTFFIVMILTLAAFSYFGGGLQNEDYGFCPEHTPYDKIDHPCRKENSKEWSQKYDVTAKGETMLRKMSSMAAARYDTRAQQEFKRLKKERPADIKT